MISSKYGSVKLPCKLASCAVLRFVFSSDSERSRRDLRESFSYKLFCKLLVEAFVFKTWLLRTPGPFQDLVLSFPLPLPLPGAVLSGPLA